MIQTPLYKAHLDLGAKLIDFGGFSMPVYYTSIIEEHNATREKAGLFDVSHMGELRVKGPGAKEYLNRIVTNDTNLLVPGKIIYSPLPNDKGGLVDDLLLYGISDEEILIVVNASNTEKDYRWIKDKLAEMTNDVVITDESADWGQIALQGPEAQSILQLLTSFDLSQLRYYTYDHCKICGISSLVSRTGYTGEDGFEIYCPAKDTETIWKTLLDKGRSFGLIPAGLGARDTLRFEAALPLYGHELSDDISPIEAGLGMFVKPDKGATFPSCAIFAEQKAKGTARKRVGIELTERGIPREGCRVLQDGIDTGYVTSGTHSPTFKKGLAMALVDAQLSTTGEVVDVLIRDKSVKGKIVELPFYSRKKK